ncbi:MAG: FAD-dependent monooxygenase, partial [Pseudonocardiaceae bacterium]
MTTVTMEDAAAGRDGESGHGVGDRTLPVDTDEGGRAQLEQSEAKSALHVLIVGAGIGGLTLATSLCENGVETEIVERAAEFTIAGAGIVLHPNGMRAMEILGLKREIETRGCRIESIRSSGPEGIREVPLQVVFPKSTHTIALRRSALHDVLLRRALAAGAELSMGTTIQSIQEQHDDRISVRFSTGMEASFDLVVGADGVGSAVRALQFPKVRSRALDLWYWRFCIPADATDSTEAWVTYRRGNRMFGFIPLGDNLVHCFAQLAGANSAPQEAGDESLWLRTTFSDLHPSVAQVLQRLDQSVTVHAGPAHIVEPHCWGDRSTVLVGDAAHAVAPTFTQGGSMAIEDALVLGDALRRSPTVARAIDEYRARR